MCFVSMGVMEWQCEEDAPRGTQRAPRSARTCMQGSAL
jgi:hypothetical protein